MSSEASSPLLDENDEWAHQLGAAERLNSAREENFLRAWSRARQLRGRIPGLASWAACSAAVVMFAIQGGGHATMLDQFIAHTCTQNNLPTFCDLANHKGTTSQKQPSTGFVDYPQDEESPSTSSSQAEASAPVPIPDPNPRPPHESAFQKVAEFCHDFFPLLLLIIVLVEGFLLPLTNLSFAQRGWMVFGLCSALIAIAQGIPSMLVYWAAMAIMLFVFYGDVLMELAVVWRREPDS